MRWTMNGQTFRSAVTAVVSVALTLSTLISPDAEARRHHAPHHADHGYHAYHAYHAWRPAYRHAYRYVYRHRRFAYRPARQPAAVSAMVVDANSGRILYAS